METKWSTVLDAIQYDDMGKMDWTLPIGNVRMAKTGLIGDVRHKLGEVGQLGIGMNGVTPNDHALSQVASRLGIPAKYAKKCYEENPLLLANHFNYWIENMEEEQQVKQWFMRGKEDELRAVLTDKYSQLDNAFVFDALGTSLQNGGIVDVKNFNLDSKYLNLRLMFPDLTHNIGTDIKKDPVMVGIHITNSEVGSSSLRIDSCLFRLVCSNGLIARVGGESLMAQRHVHLTRGEMENRVADAIASALEAGDGILEDFARTKEIKVPSVMKVLEKLAKGQKYSESFTDTLKSSFNSEPGNTAFHLVNAFTHASQTLPIERRLEVETYAGNLMNDFLVKNNKKSPVITKVVEEDKTFYTPVADDLFDF